MVPPIAGLGPSANAVDERHRWLTPERLTRVRAILLALSLFLGLVVYVFHTLVAARSPQPLLITKLRGVNGWYNASCVINGDATIPGTVNDDRVKIMTPLDPDSDEVRPYPVTVMPNYL